MKNKKHKLYKLIIQLEKYDDNILLEKYEVSAVKLIKINGDFIYNLFFFKSAGELNKDKVMLNYSAVKNNLIQLYVESVLIAHYISANEFNKTEDILKIIPNFDDKFGLELVNLMINAIGAISDSVHSNNVKLFGAAIKALNLLILNILHLYGVDLDTFYMDVREYVNIKLENDTQVEEDLNNKLESQFNGKNIISLNVKLDNRKKIPFIGFNVTINGKTHIFKEKTWFKSFLYASQYINEKTEFKNIKFNLDIKTKHFLNKYDIMFIKEDKIIEDMSFGFYPVLVPKGATNIDEFLNTLT